jgi:error-prone DNA polymerase
MAQRIVAERRRRGPYRSLVDFLRRTPAALKRPAVENLIWVGAFEALGLTRRELLWQTGIWLGPESDARRTGGRNDHPQQELALDSPHARMAFADLDDADRLVAEYRMLRFSTDLHPLALLRDQLPPDTVSSERFTDLDNHSTVRVSGLVTARQRPSTAKGYLFVLMEDEAGAINVIVRPEIYERHRSAIRLEPFLSVVGRLQKDGATMNVIAHRVEVLRPAGRAAAGGRTTRSAPDPETLYPSLPETVEYWPEGKKARSGSSDEASGSAEAGVPPPSDPFRYLTALRQNAPETKSWG